MVRNGGSAHVYAIGDVVDADFAMAEQPENAQAGGIADELKSFGSFFKSLCGRHGWTGCLQSFRNGGRGCVF